uniref:Serine/threonine-protein phosphatase 2A regulatory subunit B'' subunit gamma n=1 Tax=Romanomermis culicivorax TaxID=13658 RepID=A0A915KQ75_ROMCU
MSSNLYLTVQNFVKRKSIELLDNSELKWIWQHLDLNYTPPLTDEDKMINYKSFKIVGATCTPKAREFFTASTFAKFQQRDSYGRISITLFFNYIMRKTWLRQSRIGLSLYDLTGQGFLTESDLELYITELFPSLPHLQKLEKSLHSFYVCTAVRRFMFFLDPKRLGKVKIIDILASGFLDDLLELSFLGQKADKLEQNWFSVANTLRVYGQYVNLDTDRNGMLSKNELKQYGSRTLTDVFIDRVFQECLTYEGEMDYKAFLDFVLAMENKNDPSSLQYFLRILDVRQLGYLDAFAINYFFRSIRKALEEQDQPPVSFEDIKDEIFDMVKPENQLRITLKDLTKSQQGGTIVGILIDINGFWTYENRECLATESQKDEEADLL